MWYVLHRVRLLQANCFEIKPCVYIIISIGMCVAFFPPPTHNRHRWPNTSRSLSVFFFYTHINPPATPRRTRSVAIVTLRVLSYTLDGTPFFKIQYLNVILVSSSTLPWNLRHRSIQFLYKCIIICRTYNSKRLFFRMTRRFLF